MPDSPHIALVSWGFPPFRGSGTFRPLAVANALAEAGARVTVIAASRETFLVHYGADPGLESQIDPRVSVHRLPFYPENPWPLIDDWGPERAADPKRFAAERRRVLPPFPEKVYESWIPAVGQALRDIDAADPVALILATGGPYGQIEASVDVAADLGIPLVIDDRDSFLADVFTAEPHEWYRQRLSFGLRWFRCAREVWFVNPPIEQWHSRRFPEYADRFRVVENGWDPGIVDPTTITTGPRTPLRIGYVGLVPTNFPMDMLLEAWRRVRDSSEHPVELVFTGPLGYTEGSPFWRSMHDRIRAAEGVSWAGHVSRPELAGVYAGLDALLLAKEGGELVTGGKTYEYAATGLPIAGVVDPQSDAVRVLRDYPRFHPVAEPGPDAAAAALTATLADALATTPGRVAQAQAFGQGLTRRAALDEAVRRVMELAR